MFISTHTDKGTKYVRLIEAYRDENGKRKTRVVKSFGRLDAILANDPDGLKKLKSEYSTKEQRRQVASSARLEAAVNHLKWVSTASRRRSKRGGILLRYGHFALRALWEKELGMKHKISNLQKKCGKYNFDFNDVLSFIIFSKIINPSSIFNTYCEMDKYLGCNIQDVHLHSFYQVLDFLKDNKDEIFRFINNKLDKKYNHKRSTMIFYDVTNTYFEAPLTDEEMGLVRNDYEKLVHELAIHAKEGGILEDEHFDENGFVKLENLPQEFLDLIGSERIKYLRMRGPSKEHRMDLPIVSIALVIDKNGFPLDFELYSGNQPEVTAMKRSISSLSRKYNIKNAIVVADRGLNSVNNLKMLKECGLGFLVAQKVSQFTGKLLKEMLDLDSYTKIDTIDSDNLSFKSIDNWEKKGTNNKSINCKLVFTFSENRKKRDLAVLEIQKKIVEDKMARGEEVKPRSTGWASLVKTDTAVKHRIIGVDENIYNKKKELCGFSALIFDNSNESGEDSLFKSIEIIRNYRNLEKIEECFRIMKSNLGLRPMYVWTPDHIYAHIAICVLALVIIRLLQDKLYKNNTPMTINEICNTLGTEAIMALPELHDDILFIRGSWGFNIRREYPNYSSEQLVEIIKKRLADNDQRLFIEDILQACGLELPPDVTIRRELGRCLGVRFTSNEDAVPRVRLNQ